MSSYSQEFKEQIVRKMMPPNNQSIASLARSTGISMPTLYAWRNVYRSKGYVMPTKGSSPDGWDAKAQLAAVIQTAFMNDAERSEYCRQHGLYPEQLEAWKVAFESMDTHPSAANKSDLANERRKNKLLEKELRRKEKALAEAAPLLVLRKKAEAIWGINEED
jgi:transposase-like protein